MMTKSSLLAVLAVSSLLAFSVPNAAQSATCLADNDIQNAISQGVFMGLPAIYRQHGLSPYDIVGRTKVCERNGDWYYVLRVLKDGYANNLWVNARTGTS